KSVIPPLTNNDFTKSTSRYASGFQRGELTIPLSSGTIRSFTISSQAGGDSLPAIVETPLRIQMFPKAAAMWSVPVLPQQ
ncbi:MAG: hypothetical protein ACOVLE_05385, partial [Pirellula staleyi]